MQPITAPNTEPSKVLYAGQTHLLVSQQTQTTQKQREEKVQLAFQLLLSFQDHLLSCPVHPRWRSVMGTGSSRPLLGARQVSLLPARGYCGLQVTWPGL